MATTSVGAFDVRCLVQDFSRDIQRNPNLNGPHHNTERHQFVATRCELNPDLTQIVQYIEGCAPDIICLVGVRSRENGYGLPLPGAGHPQYSLEMEHNDTRVVNELTTLLRWHPRQKWEGEAIGLIKKSPTADLEKSMMCHGLAILFPRDWQLNKRDLHELHNNPYPQSLSDSLPQRNLCTWHLTNPKTNEEHIVTIWDVAQKDYRKQPTTSPDGSFALQHALFPHEQAAKSGKAVRSVIVLTDAEHLPMGDKIAAAGFINQTALASGNPQALPASRVKVYTRNWNLPQLTPPNVQDIVEPLVFAGSMGMDPSPPCISHPHLNDPNSLSLSRDDFFKKYGYHRWDTPAQLEYQKQKLAMAGSGISKEYQQELVAERVAATSVAPTPHVGLRPSFAGNPPLSAGAAAYIQVPPTPIQVVPTPGVGLTPSFAGNPPVGSAPAPAAPQRTGCLAWLSRVCAGLFRGLRRFFGC